jgi:hypothetical protein
VTPRRAGAWGVLIWLVAAGVGSAQAPSDPIGEGIRAYRRLDFDVAAGLLRRGLVRLPGDVSAAQRATALVYLGAADLFRGRRDSAAAVFRRLVLLDPRYRPDALIFPPEVTSAFDAVRQRTKAVALVLPPDTEFTLGSGGFSIRLVASSLQRVDVTLLYEDGTPFRALYFGPMGDSMQLQWDGYDAAGLPPPVPRVLLRVASRAPSGELGGIAQLPLDLRVIDPDTLVWPAPPASTVLGERATGAAARRALLGGLLLSAAVTGLPAVVGSGKGDASAARLVVAAAVGFAGVVGFVLHRPGRPLAATVQVNRAMRDAWQRRTAEVSAENARRRAVVRLAVHTGTISTSEQRGP